jgi:hypothetical protein
MPGVAVVNSGNYDLQIATGFQVDAFVLDDALKGVLDNTEYVLDGTTEFADVMDSVTNVMVRRGRVTWATSSAPAQCHSPSKT